MDSFAGMAILLVGFVSSASFLGLAQGFSPATTQRNSKGL
jgi:hypothetical protein